MGQVLIFPRCPSRPSCLAPDVMAVMRSVFGAYDAAVDALDGEPLDERKMERMLARARSRQRSRGQTEALVAWMPRVLGNLVDAEERAGVNAPQRAVLAGWATRTRAALNELQAA